MDTTPLSKDMTVKFELGKPLTVELNGDNSLTGFVHAVDHHVGILCLELIPSAEPALISIQNITATSTIMNAQQPERQWPSKPVIDVDRVRAEEERVMKKKRADFEKIGVDVSPVAQAIFDTLAKTLPCKWQRDTIIVFDTVRLLPPYDVKSISGDGDPGEISRVRMILEREGKTIRDTIDENRIIS